jgi:RNA polymerase sigma factor (sigma-70 family)
VEASSIPATAGLTRPRARPAVGPLLRLRSDEQLVKLFRQGNEDAFRAIHDRYRARLFAYARQMLSGSRQDAEDALQDVFVRAYGALRANDREVSLRAWLYRVAHNRCIDELRRPAPPPPEMFEQIQPPAHDPIAETEQRESLRRLVEDVRRLPEQQRSALLMREIVGMPYADLAAALDVTVPAVKSLLVRARMGLAQAAEARDTACVEIREELVDAHDRGVRASGLARRHIHDCAGCRAYKRELTSMRERFAALTPALGPFALLAKLLGIGGGGAAAGSTAAAGGGAGAAAGGAAAVSCGAAVGGSVTAGHVAAVVAAAVVAGGGAVEMKRTLSPPSARPAAVVIRAEGPQQRPLLAAAASVQARPAVAPLQGSHPSSAAGSSRAAGAATAKAVKLKLARKPTGTAVAVVPPPVAPVTLPVSNNGGAAAPPDDTIVEDPVTVDDPALDTPTDETTDPTTDSATPTTTGGTTTQPPTTGTASGPTGSAPAAGAGTPPASGPSGSASPGSTPQAPATPSTTGGAGTTPSNTVPPQR